MYAQINKMNKEATTTVQVNQSNGTRTVNPNSIVHRVVTSYNGMINISPDINSKMQTEWQTSSAQFGGNHLKAELWKVTYQHNPKRPGYTEIILQQRVSNVNLSYQSTTGGVSYSIGNSITALATENNLAVILFCNPLKSAPGMMIKGKPDDGSSPTRQTILHHYACDAKYKLGQNIIYGIYSIVPGKTDMNHLDFSFFMPANANTLQSVSFISDVVDDITGVASKVIDGVTYYFDQVYNGVTGLAKLVINGALDIDGFFINEAGEIFYTVGGGLVNLIAFGNLPKVRSMRQSEYDWANKEIFNGTLPDIGRIRVFNFMKPGGRNFYTWPSPGGSDIYMNIGDAYDDPLNYSNTSYPFPGHAFIHEMSHAWQINNYGASDMVLRYFGGGGIDQSYDPDSAHSNITSNFNLEQQATLVDRTFLQIYFDTIGKWSCPRFQQQWVEINVRNGVKFDMPAIEMQKHANDPAIKPFVGTVHGNSVFSKGNSTDGGGYYMQGSIPGSFLYYSNSDKKAFANWGQIRKKYEALGVEFGILSWPVGDNTPTPKKSGAYQYFKGGVIYYSPPNGAYYLSGPIFTKWKEQGYENGKLGFPKSDPVISGSGNNSRQITSNLMITTTQLFEGGELFLQASRLSLAAGNESSAPVHVIYSNILSVWNPDLGFPISDQVSISARPASTFVHGQSTPAFDSVATENAGIYYSNFKAHIVSGEILNTYKSLGGSTSALGLPTSDQIAPAANGNLNKMVRLTGDCSQQFQGGTIYYTDGKIDVQYKGNYIMDTKSQIIIKRVH